MTVGDESAENERWYSMPRRETKKKSGSKSSSRWIWHRDCVRKNSKWWYFGDSKDTKREWHHEYFSSFACYFFVVWGMPCGARKRGDRSRFPQRVVWKYSCKGGAKTLRSLVLSAGIIRLVSFCPTEAVNHFHKMWSRNCMITFWNICTTQVLVLTILSPSLKVSFKNPFWLG